MGIIAWIVLGLIAGAIAKLLMPGRDPGGFILTIVLGIAGALVGGFIANVFGLAGVDELNLWSIVLAIGGAFLLLLIYNSIARPGGRWHTT